MTGEGRHYVPQDAKQSHRFAAAVRATRGRE